MGFLSKLWKGVKKGFKAIFKPIKKVFKSFGKFMGKLGIAGQIALMFIPIPGMGFILGKLGKVASWAVKGISNMGHIGKAVGTILGKGVEFAQMAKAGFDTVSNAVTGFFKTTGKWIGGKLGMAQYKGLTWDKAWGEYSKGLANSWEKLGSKASEFWDTDIKGATGEYKGMPGKGALTSDELSQAVDPLDAGSAYQQDMNAQMRNQFNQMEGGFDSLNSLNPSLNPVETGYTFDSSVPYPMTQRVPDSTIYDVAPGGPSAPATTPVTETKSLLDRSVDYTKELPGKMANNLVMTGLSQAAMGAIQGEPEVDMSPMWGARRGAGIEDFTASIGYQPTNYQQYVVDSTSNSIVPPQYQQYGGGTNFWEQLMAQYNRPVSATA